MRIWDDKIFGQKNGQSHTYTNIPEITNLLQYWQTTLNSCLKVVPVFLPLLSTSSSNKYQLLYMSTKSMVKDEDIGYNMFMTKLKCPWLSHY